MPFDELEYRKQYRKDNKERITEVKKAWYKRNKERVLAKNKK